ncbi:MAG: GTPase HflX [Hyphomicrobiales bacterium]
MLHPDFKSVGKGGSTEKALRSAEDRLEEACGLVRAIDLEIACCEIAKVSKINPATLVGPGKVEEIGARITETGADLVIFNTQISPGQQRNLERLWKVKVLDRTGLILEIFGRRARTREGRLQVDLAHLTYQKSRLVRSWTHLERQRGGVGFMGGPGERQIESDRRVLQEKISKIERQLDTVRNTRDLQRKARKRVPTPVVALVGYTNAGKSTLFNRLTEAQVLAKDQLFATLDPTMRKTVLPHGREVILSDTVGFISDLPTELVAAFHATLEEVLEADLILHVRDISHSDTEAQAGDVLTVLSELGIDETAQTKIAEVWNKTDLLDDDRLEPVENMAARSSNIVCTSALTGEGADNLLNLIEERLSARFKQVTILVPAGDGAGLSWVYRAGEVLERHHREDGSVELEARLPAARFAEALSRHNLVILPQEESQKAAQ